MKTDTEIIAQLGQMYQDLEDLCFIPYDGVPMSPGRKAILAEALNPVISGGIALGWKHGLIEFSGLDLYGAYIRDGVLTNVEIIRQMIGAHPRRKQDVIDKLRRLADVIEIEAGESIA